MACANTSVTLGGFTITFISRSVSGGNTTFCYEVKGNGTAPHDLSNFVVEVCPNNPTQFINFINIVSCTKQVDGGPIVSASCTKVTKPNPSGNQVNLIGVKFDEPVGKNETVTFCFTLDAVLGEDCVNVGYKAGQDIFQTTSAQRINGPVCGVTPPPPPPGTKTIPFCCYVTIPEGFEPVVVSGNPVVFSAIVSNCTFLCEGTEEITGEVNTDPPITCIFEMPKTDLVGCVQIQNALQIREIGNTQTTFVCCNTCVCIEETLCIACPGCPTTPTDLAFTIDQNAFAVTFVDSCAGKSEFKITGQLVITFVCPACPT